MRFTLDSTHQVDSNIASNDSCKDEYDLTQQERDMRWESRSVGASQGKVLTPYWKNIRKHKLHPLDMVTLVMGSE